MISHTLTYTDFDDETQTETFWFNLSRDDVIFGNMDLVEKFEDLEKRFSGPSRDLERSEVLELLSIIRRLFQLSYGERYTVDGKTRFRQSPEAYQAFKDSAAHDAMLWDLFSDTDKCMAFLAGIMPKDLREQAKAREAEQRKQPQDRLPKQVEEKPAETNVFDENPSEVVVEEDLDGLSDDEFKARIQGRKAKDLTPAELEQLVKRSGVGA